MFLGNNKSPGFLRMKFNILLISASVPKICMIWVFSEMLTFIQSRLSVNHCLIWEIWTLNTQKRSWPKSHWKNIVYLRYFETERNGPRWKYKDLFGVYGSNVLKGNGLSKCYYLNFGSVSRGYHVAISGIFVMSSMKSGLLFYTW